MGASIIAKPTEMHKPEYTKKKNADKSGRSYLVVTKQRGDKCSVSANYAAARC